MWSLVTCQRYTSSMKRELYLKLREREREGRKGEGGRERERERGGYMHV